MLAKSGSMPKYDLIFDGSGTHTSSFTYLVNAHNMTAVGSGRSKKEAKHEAARKILEKLTLNEVAGAQSSEVPPEPLAEVVSPYKDKVTENAVGALQTMCMKYQLELPEYDEVGEGGPDHAKTFTISCSVGTQKKDGTGRTKKQAKQLSALNMMNDLKDSLDEILRERKKKAEQSQDNRSRIEKICERYKTSVGGAHKSGSVAGSYETLISDVSEELLEKGKAMLRNIKWSLRIRDADQLKNVEEDWMGILTEICKTMAMTVEIIPSRPGRKGECVFIRLGPNFDAVFGGTGQDVDSAVQNAAISGLRFLNVCLRGGSYA